MPKAVESLLKRHSHVLVYVGALVVFLSFVIKEGLRERWKETADAIETAEYMYALQEQGSDMRKEIKAIVYSVMKPANRIPYIDEKESEAKQQVRNARSWIDENVATLSNADILANQLPPHDSTRMRLATIHGETDHIVKTITAMETKLYGSDDDFVDEHTDSLAVEPAPLSKDDREQCKILPENAMRLLSATANTRQLLITTAKNTRDSDVVYSQYAWWISALLFAVGWGLSLLGKLYGVPDVVDAE